MPTLLRPNKHFAPTIKVAEAAVFAVAHKEFLPINLLEHKNSEAIIYDVKGILDSNVIDGRL